MKKSILSLALVVLLATTTMAQNISLGVKLGANISSFTSLPAGATNGGSGFGLNGGVFARFKIAGFYLQPELTFSQRVGKLKDPLTETSITVSYLDLPVLFGRSFFGGVFRANLGPVFATALGSSVDVKTPLGNVSGGTVNDLTSFNTGLQVGVGSDLGSITLDLRYEYMFNTISSNTSPRFNGIHFAVGYKFLK